MELLIGIMLALAICSGASVIGLDRDRAFYPTMAIVIASYYGLFAAIGGSTQALMPELIGIVLFMTLAVVAFRRNTWYAVAALALHGVFDWFHAGLITNPGVPGWWPGFCMAFDVVAAAWLAVLTWARARPPAAAWSAQSRTSAGMSG